LPRPKKSFSPEFKDEAVKMVIETSRPIARVAKELGINEGTLGNWVSVYRREHAGEEPHESTSSVMVLVHPWRAAAGRMMAWADVEMGALGISGEAGAGHR
jgi:transposase-like protein